MARATTVPVEGYASCHEDTTKDLPDGTRLVGYQHTHWAVRFRARIHVRGARKFDVHLGVDTSGNDVWVHPNVQKLSVMHLEQCMTQYMKGRKYDIEKGMIVYKEPVKYECKLPQQFAFTRELLLEMCEAPSLLETCVAGEVRPRSVSDVRALRDEAKACAKKFKHKFDPSTFKVLPLPAALFAHPRWHRPGQDQVGCRTVQKSLRCQAFQLNWLCRDAAEEIRPGYA